MVVHQKLLALEQVCTILTGQGLSLDASESFWIEGIVPAWGYSIGNCSATVGRVTQQSARLSEFSQSWRVWTLHSGVHCQDWAPTALDEDTLVLSLGPIETEAEACVLVPNTKHVLWSRVLVVLVRRQYLLNLGDSHSVAHLLLGLEVARHFLTERWCWECEFEINLAAVLGHLRNGDPRGARVLFWQSFQTWVLNGDVPFFHERL